MNLFQTRYVSVYLFLLIQTVCGIVSFTNMNLTQVPVNQINRRVTLINLSRNLISRVDDNTFVLFPRLSTLSLYSNAIIFVSDLAFNGTSMSSLNMANNKLTALPRFASIGSSLQWLFVHRNLIARVGKDEFTGVTRLQSLNLHSNELSFFHPEAFLDCANTMDNLFLSDNRRLTSIPGEIFTEMGKLNLLLIHYTALTSFPDFSYLPDNNNLTRLWVSSAPIGDLEHDALYKLGKLNNLVLSGIGLTRVPDLSRQRVLGHLSLTYNNIRDIPSSAFDNLPLYSLDLGYNKLTRLPDLQSVQSTLRNLGLTRNNLSTATCENIYEMIANCPLLTSVRLSNTNIKTFPDILKLNRSFNAINILNPTTMRCDCAMEWMIGLEDRVRYTDIKGTSMPCAAPPRLVGRQWSTINRTDLCEDNEAVSGLSTPPLLPTFSTSYPSLVTTTIDKMSMTSQDHHDMTRTLLISGSSSSSGSPTEGSHNEAVSGLSTPPLLPTFSTSTPSLVTTTIDKMAMTSQDHHDMTRTHLINGSSSSSGSPSEGSPDKTGERNILASALGGALGVVLLILVIVIVLLVCRMRSSSSSNQSRENKQEGEDNDAYLKIGDGNRTYMEPASHYTELTEHTTNPNQGGVYDEIDDLALGPVVNGAQGNNSAVQAETATGEIPE